jgi:hypothetical protein
MFMFSYQNAGHNHNVEIANKSFENMEMTERDKNYICDMYVLALILNIYV